MTRNDLKGWGIALLRITIGGIFVAHGAQKLFVTGLSNVAGFLGQLGVPLPMVSALALTAAEFLGGLALVVGLLTRWAALPIAFSMIVAAVTVHLKAGFFLPNGVEYVLALFLASVSLALTGSGAFSVDRLLERRREQVTEKSDRPLALPVQVR